MSSQELDAALAEMLGALASPTAVESLETDPYWPKWDSPWWRMTLLDELGLAREIPASAVAAMVRVLRTHYLKTFPFRIEEVPPGKDPIRQIACHCALGTMARVLTACGVDVDTELPWLRPWFLRYQLEDGGLNCDEAVYTRLRGRSSVVSTLPALETMLLCTRRPFTPEEERFVDRGADYLIERRLLRSVSKGGAMIDEAWCNPCFPRFYHYDVLRGLAWLVRWAEIRERALPQAAIEEAVGLLELRASAEGELAVGRRGHAGAGTLARDATGAWVRAPARTFPLLDLMSEVGRVSPELGREWRDARDALSRLRARGLVR